LNLYTLVLYVHAIAVLVITAALTIESWTLFELRRTGFPAEARSSVQIVPLIGIAAIGSLVIIYATGAYLTESLHAWEFAWPRLAVAEIVLYALFGAFSGARLRAIRRASSTHKVNQSEWGALTRSPFLKLSLSTRIWIVLGTILLTAAKPPLKGSLVIVAGPLILGFASSGISFPRRRVASTAEAGSR
jgi:hypothetical protein